MTSRPDLSALSKADRAWLDALGLEVLRRDDVSGETGGRLMTEHREAALALRADEAADGRAPEPLDEAFGTPASVVDGLVGAQPDDDAVDAEERQTATVLAQCSGVAVLVGIYLVLIWPLQHVVGDNGGASDVFGLPQLVLFGGLIAAVGGFWAAIRSYGFGELRTSGLGLLTFVLGVGAVMGAHLVPGPEGPWWLAMPAGAVLMVAGWRLVDAGGAPSVGSMSTERWYRTLDLRLAVVHLLPRRQRELLAAEARELAGEDPIGELGPVGVWARRAVDADTAVARTSHRNLAVGWFVIALLTAGLAVVSLAVDAGLWAVAAWGAFALLCLGAGVGEHRRAASSS